MSNRPNVIITNPFVYEVALDLLKEKCNLIIVEEPKKEHIIEKVTNVDAIFWSSKHSLDQEIVDAAGPNLKIVSTASAGYDNIDVDLLKSRGIKFGNAANVLNDCVAEVAVALTLTAAHRMQEGYKKIINGEWPSFHPQWLIGQQLCDSTLGIVGLGRIGTEIAIRIKSFKVRELLYSGPSIKPQGEELGAKFVSFDELLEMSDFIIIACPLNKSTRNLFGKTEFSKMKSNAIVVNISRGAVINQEDLVDALSNQTIGGAALDVAIPEPLPPDHPLMKLDNCVLSPHIGSATYKTRSAMHILAAQNILEALEEKPMPSPVF